MSIRVPTSIFIEKNTLGDITTNNKFGANNTIGTTFIPVSVGGFLDHRTTATTLEAIGNNAADTLAGLGARKIIVQGLDNNFNEVEEEINMNGTTATASTTTSFIRVYRAWVSEVGTYGGANYNDIDIRVSGGGQVLARITGFGTINTSGYGIGQALISSYCSPIGQTYYISDINIVVDGNKTADVVLYRREMIDNTTTNIQSQRVLWTGFGLSGNIEVRFKNPINIAEKTDIWFEGRVGSGTGGISINYDVEIVVADPEL